MKLVSKLYLSFGTLLAIALFSAFTATLVAREAAFHLERTRLAHEVYEGYLSLSNHTYQLFKQFGDAMLIGDRDNGTGETELLAKIRQDIDMLRTLIAREVQLVGEEEIEELEGLAAIEGLIETLLTEYSLLLESSSRDEFFTDWGRLSHVLDEKIDLDFNALVLTALEGEAEEVRETAEESAYSIQLFNSLAGALAIIAVVAAAASLWLLLRGIRRPIDKLLVGANELAAGNLAHRIDADGRSELDNVGRAFNSMADEISTRETALSQSNVRLESAVADRTAELERALKQLKTEETDRRRLLADVSHELRTPLTIIQGEADIALRRGVKAPEVYKEALEKSRDAAKHTARLVDDLLFVARREAGETRLRTEMVDLLGLVPTIIDENRSLANGRSSVVSFVSGLEEAVVRCDGNRIRQVVVVLLENALRYGASRVDVQLHAAPSGIVVMVTDNGPGMSEEEQARAFDRFFRGSNAAERYKEGAGLGLPVARAIVEAHGGRIALESEPGDGVTVSFTLPTRPRLEAVS